MLRFNHNMFMGIVGSCAGTFLAAGAVAQEHFDVRPRVESSRIVTDGYDDATGTTEPNVQVFGYDFGENADDPFFAQDPGLNAAAGSGLPAGSQFRFNILTGLQYWSGTGPVSFGGVPSGETLDLNFGASTRTIASGGSFQTGFAIQTVGGDGSIHRHLNSFLKGADGNTVPAGAGPWGSGDGVEAADGIYLFGIELLVDPTGGVANSDPIYVVFNNGLSETAHDHAIDWVQENVVPEPAGIAFLLACGALLCASRRNPSRPN
jgi:hypothetical protein